MCMYAVRYGKIRTTIQRWRKFMFSYRLCRSLSYIRHVVSLILVYMRLFPFSSRYVCCPLLLLLHLGSIRSFISHVESSSVKRSWLFHISDIWIFTEFSYSCAHMPIFQSDKLWLFETTVSRRFLLRLAALFSLCPLSGCVALHAIRSIYFTLCSGESIFHLNSTEKVEKTTRGNL